VAMSPPEAARIARRGVTGGHIKRKKDLSITCPPNCPAPLNLMDVTSCDKGTELHEGEYI